MITRMVAHALLSRSRLVLLLAALALVAISACLGPTTVEHGVSAPSVEDKLAQLAPSTEPPPTAEAAADFSNGGAIPAATRTARAASADVMLANAAEKPASTVTPRAAKPGYSTTASSDGLPTVSRAQLPPEARATIALINQGGPFPFQKDGALFGNRERRLPAQASGYYREYTVVTPGSRDRGARRIVAGQGGEMYYTDDHYDTFKRVIP